MNDERQELDRDIEEEAREEELELAEEEEMPWEKAGLEAVRNAVASASWKPEEGHVVFPGLEEHVPATRCSSVGEMLDHLADESESAQCGEVPWDEGAPAFSLASGFEHARDVLLEHGAELHRMGWKLPDDQ